jgi:2-polyprenyl-3-methyl-5-hydroxy-6-metoxy-1,4-benzoquinol methylase/glycosyltransferase involved in cell wall biosynthesis
MRLTLGFYVDSVPFTPGVLDGTVSLGGSESACLGLARALQALGHDVHLFATKLDPACVGQDQAGVTWHRAEDLGHLNAFMDWDVFTVLRMFPVFGQIHVPARLRLLWNQDLLTDPKAYMSTAFAVDGHVFVSEYHRRQYEDRLPELGTVLSYVTKNGYAADLVPADAVKDPNRIIHISRPERAVRPLMAMWPAFKRAHPHATLQLCRYSSMYDATGWGQVCASYDREVARVNSEVGGIEYLGELGKPALYQAIAEAAVMWYPGVADFAETSCIAAIEAQACGTPFVGSYKGALPETVPGGVLVRGDADADDYQAESMRAVGDLLDACARQTVGYRKTQNAGRTHVARYTYAAIAAEWDAWLTKTFAGRYELNRLGVLRQLLHEDDHVTAAVVAREILEAPMGSQEQVEAADAAALCVRVIAGDEQGAEDYAERSSQDTQAEIATERQGRMGACLHLFEGCTRVLDIACGNGSFALLLAQTFPAIHVTGIDYAAGNIERAKTTADELGLSDRVTFLCAPVWDLKTQRPEPLFGLAGQTFDGLFCGEFLEHVADCSGLVDHLERLVAPGARIVYTVPHGPFVEMLPRGVPLKRGHVHHFCHDDLRQVFGQKPDVGFDFLSVGLTARGHQVGHWVISYRASDAPAGTRNLSQRALVTRPKLRLSVGLIAKDAEQELAKCLSSVWAIADEIVVGDTGSRDRTAAIAQECGARVVTLAPVSEQEDGFSGARNAVLDACTGEWFLWIDTDELLVGSQALHTYLEGGIFKGYALHQNHLMLDAPMSYDTPVRVFRRWPAIQFFGCIHEQPGWGDANTDIYPALEIADVTLAHTGYLTESVRRGKMLTRNLPLLKKDRQRFPDRRLGGVLVLRDLVNLGVYDCEMAGAAVTPKATQYWHAAVALFHQHFADPADKYHAIARPWYERAIQQLGSVEIELSLGGKQGGLGAQRAKPERFWVASADEFERLVAHRVAAIRQQMTPERLKVDPFAPPEAP